MSSSYNTPYNKHKLEVSIYSNTETSLAMSTLAVWCRVVRSRDVGSREFSAPSSNSTAVVVIIKLKRSKIDFKASVLKRLETVSQQPALLKHYYFKCCSAFVAKAATTFENY